MEEVLLVIAFIWVLFAVIQDLKTREIANWLNFSLIIFALAFRFFYSVFTSNYDYILFGIFGLGLGLVVGHIFYYGRVFAGGDAKLLMALFVVIPLSSSFYNNLLIYFVFLIGLMFFGAVYSLVYSFGLSLVNYKKFKKTFLKKFYENKRYFYLSLVFVFLFLFLGFFPGGKILFLVSFLIFIFPYLYVYLKSVEESCLIRLVSYDKLTEGDWIVSEVKVGNKTIEENWEGLSKSDLRLLRKYKKDVWVKYGIPFSPAFLFALISTIIFIYFEGILFFVRFF
jgi:Flp pilus assembly protein protease CpaA